jgi:circadian clock protein KaiB
MNALKTNKTIRATRAWGNSPAARPEGKYLLRLYMAGATARSRKALRRAYQLCEAELKDNYELEVIDVYQQPELARDNQIVATPTLVKEFPLPVRRFIGNLLNTTRLFDELDLSTEDKIAH